MNRLWAAVVLLAGCGAQSAIAPGQIVSNNPCVDGILAEIAAPGQIGAVSIWSHDPMATSAPLGWATARPALGTTAEEVIAARPRLLLTGNLALGGTNNALARAGIPMRTYGVPASIAQSIEQVRDVAKAIGRESAGEALVAQIEAATRPTTDRRRKTAIIWQSGGFVPGKGTLQDDLLARAGFANASAAYGLKQWDILPVETLLQNPPDIVFMPEAAAGEDKRGLAARRRLLNHLGNRTRVIPFPDNLLFCGGPTIVKAMARMRHAA